MANLAGAVQLPQMILHSKVMVLFDFRIQRIVGRITKSENKKKKIDFQEKEDRSGLEKRERKVQGFL